MNQWSEMEFVTATRGARSLLHEGYKYTLNRRTADGHTYWRCHDRSCPGRMAFESAEAGRKNSSKHLRSSHLVPVRASRHWSQHHAVGSMRTASTQRRKYREETSDYSGEVWSRRLQPKWTSQGLQSLGVLVIIVVVVFVVVVVVVVVVVFFVVIAVWKKKSFRRNGTPAPFVRRKGKKPS